MSMLKELMKSPPGYIHVLENAVQSTTEKRFPTFASRLNFFQCFIKAENALIFKNGSEHLNVYLKKCAGTRKIILRTNLVVL